MGAKALDRFPVHLGLGAIAVSQPEFTGMAWYDAYGSRNAADGAEGRLVSMHTFDCDWDSWEMHPAGDELVICTSGAMTIIQQFPEGHQARVALGAGDYAINPPGVWHTADIVQTATAVFITAGFGTEGRPR
jgi:uncharacterized cupin superfamily protein